MSEITREKILHTLKEKLECVDYIFGMWEGGGAAWGRVDEWSDIDLGIEVEKGRIEDGFKAVENALSTLASIDLVYEVPNPPCTAQKLYHVSNSSKFLIIDLCLGESSDEEGAIDREVHGDFITHFAQRGDITLQSIDATALKNRIKARLAVLPVMFEMFQTMPLKELNRGNYIEALAFYHKATLAPLIEVLKMKYNPAQYNFGTRYVYIDFPIEIVKRLEALFFVSDPQSLKVKREEAEKWFYQAIKQVDVDNLKI